MSLRIKFSIGPGGTLDVSDPSNEYIRSNFFYISTSENGIANNPAGAPEKIDSGNISKILSENVDSVLGLFNFEKITSGEPDKEVVVATAAAQGVSNINQSLYTVSVYKKEIWYDRETGEPKEQPVWTPVTIEDDSNIIRDFNIGNNRYYKYVFRLVENTASGGVEYPSGIIATFKTSWQGWSIVELHETDDPKVFTASPKDVWKFKYNVSSGAQTQNISKTQQDTLSRYPIFSHGTKNAVGGSVTCLLGREMINANYVTKEWVYEQNPNTTVTDFIWREVPGQTKNIGGYKERLGRETGGCGKPEYISASALGFRNLSSNEAVDMLEEWRNVCYSGNPKLLKDEKGQTFIIQITDPTNTTNENWDRQPEEISFNWVEIADAKNCRVIQSN